MKRFAVWVCLAFTLSGCSAAPGNQAALPTTTQSPPTSGVTAAPTTETAAKDFQEVMVVDQKDCSIYITNFREDPVWGWVLDARLENKTDDDTLMFALASGAINGVETEALFASQVTPGKKAKETIILTGSSLAERDIGPYTDIELHFRVYDAEDWMDEDVVAPSIHIYPKGAEQAQPYIRQPQPGDQVLAENEKLRITAIDFPEDPLGGYTVELFLENKTDERVMFTVEDASVNGFMADPFYAASVGPGNCAFSRMSWPRETLEELEIARVEDLEFILRAYPEEDWLAEDLLHSQIRLAVDAG